jgi:hypothetical protein
MKKKVNLNFRRDTDADFLAGSDHIHQSLLDNPSFPSPVPTLADVKTAIDAYNVALTNAMDLGRVNVAIKNQARQDLESLLFQLGMYVMNTANGDETMLVSSGFTLAKNPEPVYITNAGNVTLSNGITSGEMVSTVATQKGVKSYLHEIADEIPTENTVWDTFASSRSRFVFSGLLPGKQYWVRVALVAGNGQVAYSEVATKFVQ